jgi:hypothetical protein
MTTDSEFAAYLRSLPREQSEEEVALHEHQHDVDRGLYCPAGEIVHHLPGEAAH